MKKSLCIRVFAVLSGLWTADAWAWNTHSKHTGTISVQSTGNGTVYLASSSTATSGSSSGSVDCGSSESGDNNTKDYWLFATANAGYHFKGWSESSGGSIVSEDNPLKYTIKVNNNATRYASFEKNPASAISFESPVNGSYTIAVGGETRPDYSSFETSDEMTLTATPADGYRVYGWYTASGGSRTYFAYGNTAKFVAMSATTIGVAFISESEVVKVSDLAGLTAALSGPSKVAEISAGTKILVPSGTTLVIPSGKKVTLCSKPATDIYGNAYTLYGYLAVVGAIDIKGVVDGTGKLLKVSRIVTQGQVITPSNTYANYTNFGLWRGENGGTEPNVCKYRDTTTKSNSPTVIGTPSCTVGWGAYANDSIVGEIGKENPKMLNVTFDTSVAVNSLKSIDGSQDSPSYASSSYLLLENITMTTPTRQDKSGSKTYTRLDYQGIMDCAHHTCEFGNIQVSVQSRPKIVNGTFKYQGEYWQQADGAFIHCDSVSIKNIKGTGNIFYFFDCGSAKSPCTLTFGAYGSVSDSNCRRAWIYSGYYNYSFSKGWDNSAQYRYCYVYGGSFDNDPAALDGDVTKAVLATGLVTKNENGRYVVYEEEVKKEVVQIGADGEKYATLQDAIDAAAAGSRLYLQEDIELEGTLTNDKTLTIDLNGRNIAGGAIVNTGKLRFEDSCSDETPGKLSSPVANDGEGEIDFTLGTYACPVTVNGGRVATHGGTFTADFAITKNAGTLQLRGGTFSSNVSSMLEEGYHRDGACRVGPYLQAGMTKDGTAKGGMDVSYKVSPMSPDRNNSLLVGFKKNKVTERSKYSDADWDLLQEILSTYETYNTDVLECVLTFDRTVEVGTVMGYGEANGYSKSFELEQTMQGGTPYRLIQPQFNTSGYSVPAYKYYFDGEFSDLRCGVKNTDKYGNRSVANIGATCTLKAVLWPTGYENYRLTLATRTVKFEGKGAICGATDYASLAEALSAANYSGTIRLSKDCTEAIVVNRATAFTIDTNNFVFAGSVAPDVNCEMAATDLGDGKTQYAFTLKAVSFKPIGGITVGSVTTNGVEVAPDGNGFYSVCHGADVVIEYKASRGYSANGSVEKQTIAVDGITTETVIQWPTVTPRTYLVNYVLDEGVENAAGNPTSYVYPASVVLDPPTWAGHTFVGWYLDADYSEKVQGVRIPGGVAQDLVFFAKWEYAPVLLTVQAPEHAVLVSVKAGEAFVDSENGAYAIPYGTNVVVTFRAEAGYDLSQTVFAITNFTNAVTQAVGVPSVAANVYAIAYELYGGAFGADYVPTNAYTVAFGDIVLPSPTKAGAAFGGWYEDARFTKKSSGAIPKGSTGDRAFFASWLSAMPVDTGDAAVITNVTDTAKVNVPANWVDNVITNKGQLSEAELQEKVQQMLQETADNGLKTWQNFALDAAGVKEGDTTVSIGTNATAGASEVTVKIETTEAVRKVAVVQVVSAVDATVSNVVTELKDVEDNVAEVAVNYAEKAPGVYRPAIVVTDAANNETLIPDVSVPAVEVVKKQAEASANEPTTTTVLTVPFSKTAAGEPLTVASLIDSASLSDGDTIKKYNNANGVYDVWTYANGTWEPGNTFSDRIGSNTTAVAADKLVLEAGQALLIERSGDAATNTLTMVGQYAETVETPIEQPAATTNEPVWNLIGNVDAGKEFDLNAIDTANARDEVVVETSRTTLPKRYSRGNDGKWSYTTNGVRKIGGLRLAVPVRVTDDSKIRGGGWFWYVSGGGDKDTKIEWKKQR